MMLIGTALLIRAAFYHPSAYRSQTAALIIGALAPLMGNLIYLLGFSPDPGFEIASLLITVTGVMFAWGIFRLRLLDLAPVARNTIIENMSDAIFVLDKLDRVADLNLAARRLISASGGEPIGQPVSQVLGEWQAALNAFQNSPAALAEITLKVQDELRHYSLRLSPLVDQRGAPIGRILMLSDVTVFEQARDAVQRVALLEEREHIARELHDNLAQVLGFVNLQSQAARKVLADGDATRVDAYLTRMASVAQNSQLQMRDYIRQLKAPVPAERRFFSALSATLEKFEHDYGLPVTSDIAPAVSQRGFEPAVGGQLLGMIQEALTNIGKHAGAASVKVSLVAQGDLAQATISDDGRGFDPLIPANEEEHFGLRFMRERAHKAGGSLAIRSAPGQGAQIVIHVPLRFAIAGEVQ